ncbi:TPA: hypothetical protein ACXORD_004148, partial [Bacillus luti]
LETIKEDLLKDPYLIPPEKFKKMYQDNIKKYTQVEKHLFPKNIEGIFYIEISMRAADKYKASEILVEKINRLLEVYKLIGDREGYEIAQKGLYKEGKELDWTFMDIMGDSDITMEKITNREEEDIKDFIKIRNKKILNGDNGNELFLLERAYSLISHSKELTLENRLLNTWLAIEHMVTPYISEAIIEKIRQVIPKVVSLYYIKDRMNELWEELNNFSKAGSDPFLEEFIKECRKEGGWKYNKILFGNGLKEESKAKKLIEATESDVNITRMIMEINGLLNKFLSTQKKLKYINELIENDLNRIYRIRNKIVHSGINVPENLNLITLRLLNYNTRLMGTIIHYMKHCEDVDIEDILNSIVETYDWYINSNTKDLGLGDIITPEYLYL